MILNAQLFSYFLHRNTRGPSDHPFATFLDLTPQPVPMEARGKFDFTATADDELSFRRGDILKVRIF